jgi:hypothetical protein
MGDVVRLGVLIHVFAFIKKQAPVQPPLVALALLP